MELLRYLRHDAMPARCNSLRSMPERLLNAVSRGVIGETITEIVITADFIDDNPAFRGLFLQPEFGQLNVANFAKAAATTNALGCAGVGRYANLCVDSKISEHTGETQRVTGAFHHAVVFGFAGRKSNSLLVDRPRLQTM